MENMFRIRILFARHTATEVEGSLIFVSSNTTREWTYFYIPGKPSPWRFIWRWNSRWKPKYNFLLLLQQCEGSIYQDWKYVIYVGRAFRRKSFLVYIQGGADCLASVANLPCSHFTTIHFTLHYSVGNNLLITFGLVLTSHWEIALGSELCCTHTETGFASLGAKLSLINLSLYAAIKPISRAPPCT